tara:strand:- start:770 stop:1456 length:687 start_codon:yes stop_codon:yes gene_type:complete
MDLDDWRIDHDYDQTFDTEAELQAAYIEWVHSWEKWDPVHSPILGAHVIAVDSKERLTHAQLEGQALSLPVHLHVRVAFYFLTCNNTASRKYAHKNMPYIPTAAEISGDGLDVMQWMAPSCAWNRLFDFCPTADEHAFYAGKVVAFHLMAHMDHQDTPGSYLGSHRHFADHRVAYVMLELSCTHKLDVRVSAQSTLSDMAWISLDHPHIRYAPGFATFDDCNYHRSKL